MHNNEDVRIRDHLIRLAEADDNIAVLWLYGSRAKGTEGPDSDYDLAVAFNRAHCAAWHSHNCN